jgi:hypothetical protein
MGRLCIEITTDVTLVLVDNPERHIKGDKSPYILKLSTTRRYSFIFILQSHYHCNKHLVPNKTDTRLCRPQLGY